MLLGACSPNEIPTEKDSAVVKSTEILATPVAPETVDLQIEDGLGRTITIGRTPQRIISLAPSNTEYLFAVGAGDQLIGRDTFSDYPEAAIAITDIGGGWGELDIETILTLNADLVLAADITARNG